MEPRHWTLTKSDLVAVLQTNQIEVASGSPLNKVDYARDKGFKAGIPKSVEPELRQAIEWVAQPRLELGLLMIWPFNGDILWFYRGMKAETDALVGCHLDQDGSYLFSWTSEQDLTPAMRTCLNLDILTEGGALSLQLTPTAYQTLLAVVDCNREWTMESLLKRQPLPNRALTASDLAEAFNRGARSKDLRWLVGLNQVVSPIKFGLDANGFEQGLRELSKYGLLDQKRDGWILSPNMQLLSATLASPLSCCSLFRRHLNAVAKWESQHVIALRCMGCLWLFQFKGLDSQNPTVHVCDSSSEEVELALSEQFHEWGIHSATSTGDARIAASSLEQKPPSSSLGGAYGSPSGQVAPPSPQEVEPQYPVYAEIAPKEPEKPLSGSVSCPKCHQPLKAGARFCGSCGIPVGQASPPPPQTCPQCSKPLKEGARFCGSCGFKIK